MESDGKEGSVYFRRVITFEKELFLWKEKVA
jgi:hypothetical protein